MLESRRLLSGDPPYAVGDYFTVPQDQELTGDVLVNDYDPEQDQLTPFFTSLPTYGQATFDEAGLLKYVPREGFTGFDFFTYLVSDGTSDSNEATVTIEVTEGGANQRPVIDTFDLSDYAPRTNDVLTASVSGSDPEGDPITYTYEWQVNGVVVQTTTTTQETDSLHLSQEGNGDKDDTITVTVTPSDAGGSGVSVDSAPAVVANSAPELDPIGDWLFLEGEVVNRQIVAYDPDGDELFFFGENLPLGLSLNSVSGVLSGTVQYTNPPGGIDQYPARIRVTDGADDDEVNPFFQVVTVGGITVTGVTITPPAGWTGSLPASGNHATFNFTVTATGPANTTVTLLWSVGDEDPGPDPDDELVWEREFTITFNGAGQGTFTAPQARFGLFSDRAGQVKGVDGRSGEYGASDPAEIYVQIETAGGTDLRESAILNVAGAVHTLSSASTQGNYNTVTANLAAPAGFNGTLDRWGAIPTLFTFTVTMTGQAGTTFENLRWSVIEPDYGISAPDDELWYERSFSLTIQPNGTGTATFQFILFANRHGEVGGVDDYSGEYYPDPIYVLIEKSDGTDIASSNTVTVRGRPQP
ncbi:MAG: Ig-like domain-containing protein [Gemmataceae bacterium]|nr:Ig-like domain-containing protein [Gemmataceae bacterium]